MAGLGTIANTAAIVIGGILGMLFGKKIPQRMTDTIQKANAVAVLFIGIGGAMANMLSVESGKSETKGTMMMILSLLAGAVIGEILDLDGKMEKFGVFLKEKTGNAKDPQFVDGFLTASLTVCIGAMAIVGSIQDGIFHDHSILFAKAVLDFIIVMSLASAKGKGCAFSAIPVAILQGGVTLLARAISPLITETAMGNLSYVGSILIFCVGLNLLHDQKIRVANLLPALIVAALWH